MGKIKPAILDFLQSDKGKDILVVLIVILVGIFSFELGRVSKSGNDGNLQIEYMEPSQTAQGREEGSVIKALEIAPQAPKSSDRAENTTGKNYFASSRGTKYYSVGCSAGKTIKQENRVYFSTAEEAEAAGYTLSSSCH